MLEWVRSRRHSHSNRLRNRIFTIEKTAGAVKLHNLMIKICDLEVSQLFLFKEQSYTGRCNVVYKHHGVDLHKLSDDQRDAFMRDVAKTAQAIDAAFNPTKINYGAFADTISHLHMHVVPKYKGGYGFGGVFEMNPQKSTLSDSEYSEIITKIKAGI
jgi:diadenosine tetraphosphate (Ap4A) HIT family hydrolase